MTLPRKTSTIGTSLLGDVLVGVVDDIRREIHGTLGTRPFAVSIVTRRWSGARRGEGRATCSELILDPPPSVSRNSRDRLGPAGREASGSVTLSNVSLRYSYEELMPAVDERTEFAYKIVEAHGHRQPARWFTPAGDPVARRGDREGDASDWYLVLNETAAMGDFDGVDSP